MNRRRRQSTYCYHSHNLSIDPGFQFLDFRRFPRHMSCMKRLRANGSHTASPTRGRKNGCPNNTFGILTGMAPGNGAPRITGGVHVLIVILITLCCHRIPSPGAKGYRYRKTQRPHGNPASPTRPCVFCCRRVCCTDGIEIRPLSPNRPRIFLLWGPR